MPHSGLRKPTCSLTEAYATITSHCLVRLVERRHYWPLYLWKWGRHNHYDQRRHLSHHDNRFFVSALYCFWYELCLVSTGWCTIDLLCQTFCDGRLISANGYANWPPRNCICHCCTIFCEAPLKLSFTPTNQRQLSIRDAIASYPGNILEKVHENYSDQMIYCEASDGSLINEIILHF